MSPTKQMRPRAAITVDGTTIILSGGDLLLDEGWAPYAQATMTAPFDDPADVEAIDPLSGDRATLSASVDGHWELTGGTGYISDPAVPGSIIPEEG